VALRQAFPCQSSLHHWYTFICHQGLVQLSPFETAVPYALSIIVLLSLTSSALWLRVVLRYDTNVSEDLTASIFRVSYYRNTTWRRNPQDFDLNLHRFTIISYVVSELCLLVTVPSRSSFRHQNQNPLSSDSEYLSNWLFNDAVLTFPITT